MYVGLSKHHPDLCLHLHVEFSLCMSVSKYSPVVRPLVIGLWCPNDLFSASLVGQRQRIHLPMQETWVRPLDQENRLEKDMATHSNILIYIYIYIYSYIYNFIYIYNLYFYLLLFIHLFIIYMLYYILFIYFYI